MFYKNCMLALHFLGHSRKKNVFLYGCSASQSWMTDDVDNPSVLADKTEDMSYKVSPYSDICHTCHLPYMSLDIHVTCHTCHLPYMSLVIHVTCHTCHLPSMSLAIHVTCHTCHISYMSYAIHVTCHTCRFSILHRTHTAHYLGTF